MAVAPELLGQFGEQQIDQGIVYIVATQMSVAVGGENFENSFLDAQNGDVEGAAAQIVDRHVALGGLVQPIRQRCRRGLIDEADDFESGKAAGIFGRLALAVIEISGTVITTRSTFSFQRAFNARSLSAFSISAEICGGVKTFVCRSENVRLARTRSANV